MKGFFFFEFVGVLGGSPGLGKGNPGWVPSLGVTNFVAHYMGGWAKFNKL